MRIAVIGAGISGLATAFFLDRQCRSCGLTDAIVVLEKEMRVGGKIRSDCDQGYLVEWGPNGFLDSKPATLELCGQLGLSEDLLRSDDNARKRFIFADGRLQRVPETAAGFLRSTLISWPGKLRLGAELLVPRGHHEDESLADFVRRRLGPEVLEKLIGPMVSGIFAGDPESMSLRSCFPRIHELEQQYGGLIRAMLRLAGQKRRERRAGKVVAGAAGPGGILTSFEAGLQTLPDALAASLGDSIRSGVAAATLKPKGDGFEIVLADGRSLMAEVVICALPAPQLAGLLEISRPAMSTLLRQIPYAPLQVACFGYRSEDVPDELNGFGYLTTRSAGLHSLGTLWDSSIFPQRAPVGRRLLRTMLGGATRPGAGTLSAEQVRGEVMEDLRTTLGVEAAPEWVRIISHAAAIPQYPPGHGRRLAALEELAAGTPGLFLVGNAFYGVGLNDCVAAAGRVADRVLALLRQRRG